MVPPQPCDILKMPLGRAHAAEHTAYIALKHRLAAAHGDDRQAHTEGKVDHLWAVIRRADRWAAETGWAPAQPDA